MSGRLEKMKNILSIAVVLCVAALMMAPMALAGEKAADKKVDAVGVVKATKDQEGKVTDVKLMTAEGAFTVALEGKGADLAKMDGKSVEAIGTVTERNGAKVLNVQNFKEAYMGMVKAEKEGETVKGAKLATTLGDLTVAPEEKAKAMAKMDGKQVIAYGTLASKDDVKTLTVTSFKAVEKKETKKEEKKMEKEEK